MICLSLSLLLLFSQAQPGSGNGPPNGSGSGDTGTTDSGSKCTADGSDASYQETISGGVRTITTSGCPNHESYCTGKPGISVCDDYGVIGSDTEATDQGRTVEIPATPVLAATTSSTECEMGTIAIALNGVSIYSGAVDTQCNLVEIDDCSSEWTGFDCCGGHSQMSGDYHYHFAPACLLAQTTDLATGHSAQIGWAYDGFPIYGPKSMNGVTVYNCGTTGADAMYCQDSCGGLEMELPEVDNFKYRYYFTGFQGDLTTTPFYPRPLHDEQYPFTLACYRGLTQSQIESGSTGETGVTDGYVEEALAGFGGDNLWPSTCVDTTFECDAGVTTYTAEPYASVTTAPETDTTTTTDETEGPDCDVCVHEFAQNGGCACMLSDDCDEQPLIPEGCDPCGEEAVQFCNEPSTTKESSSTTLAILTSLLVTILLF